MDKRTYSAPQMSYFGSIEQLTQKPGVVPPGKNAGATDGRGNAGSPRPFSGNTGSPHPFSGHASSV